MKTDTSFLRVLAVAAVLALPAQSLAQSKKETGFYVGGGGHLNNAEFSVTKAFKTTDKVVLKIVSSKFEYRSSGSATTAAATTAIATSGAIALKFTADDKSAFGFGAHGGYRINKHFAVEGSYSMLGEFTSKVAVTHAAISNAGGITGVNIDANTLKAKYTAEASAFSGAVLGTYPLADNATVFGRLGYYALTLDESLTSEALVIDDDDTPDFGDNGDAKIAAGKATLGKDLAGDASGFLFGGGVEIAFGRQQNILVRAEFEMLADAVAEAEALTRFGVTASYSF